MKLESDKQSGIAELGGIDPRRLYTTREIAMLTNFSPEFFEAMRYRGEGPPYLTVNRRAVRYVGRAVIDWLSAGMRAGGAGHV